jgi:predicted membrane protein DUF2254
MSALSSEQAAAAGALIVMTRAVGDTLVEGTVTLRVHGAKEPLDEKQLMKGVRLGTDRTFEQDPKYAIRLLVDIAIQALSPRSTTRLPRSTPSIRSRTCCFVWATRPGQRLCLRPEWSAPPRICDADPGGLSHARLR